MENVLIVALLTGLTTGGLSCFAVQGGLLTGSLAQQMDGTNPKNARKRAAEKPALTTRETSLTVLLFLLAKLAVYTLAGFLLGALGSILTLSPVTQGIIQLLIGVFLIGNALRMFNVHPIFRYFSFEPPAGVNRYIRRVSKGNDRLATPLFLGALTILIPCGVTQSMMAVAVGSGSPWLGAGILFAFVLGTSPAFFGVTVLAAGLGKTFQKVFYPLVASVVLVLGFYTINGGLNLVGSPYSVNAIQRSMTAQAAPPAPAASANAASNVVQIDVINSGYAPEEITAAAGEPVELHLVTNGTYSCSRAFTIPALGMSELLPADGDTVLQLPAQEAGTKLYYTCSMGMYGGVIYFQ
jgi:sulfite exporter TauE/SafE